MDFQKEPAPTAPGIRSEPSKRKVVAPWRTSATLRETGSWYQSREASLYGAIAPPALTQPSMEAPVEKYCMTARTSGRSSNMA